MDKISQYLIQLSDKLDQDGYLKCANVIDELLEHRSLHKVAQYVGVIGYVLKQQRAMGNCIRKKRVASKASMQEVVLECLKEYQDGQVYGTNDWTSKYAQVIKQIPNKFASSHVDFLNAVVEENNILEHVDRVKKAHTILSKNNIGDNFISEVIANLEGLEERIKEGDGGHYPFKLAAPIQGYEPEKRSRWSRFWAPSWTRRGKDKDAQFEMDNILESIMNVSSNVQQIRTNIARLKQNARNLPNRQLVENINRLSPYDWTFTSYLINNIQKLLDNIWKQNPDNPDIAYVASVLSDLSSNMRNIYEQISRIQRNMYNLRLRDAIKGRGSLPAATDEYADLDQALSRLYKNPLDEKALYYSQKLHGRLEDALNMREITQPSDYYDWINMPSEQMHEIPGIDSETEVSSTNIPSGSSENTIQSVATLLQEIADPIAIKRLAQKIKEILATDITPESREAFNILLDALEDPVSSLVNKSTPKETVQTNKSTEHDIDPFNPDDVQWEIPDFEQQKQMPQIANTFTKLRKMADVVEQIDEHLANFLREYLQEEEEQFPKFPETCRILKDEATSRLKITQKKGGEVMLNT